MLTKKQKEHKIKLIYLIIMVNAEYARRKPFKTIWETITFAMEQVFWVKELSRIARQKTFRNGGLAIIGENKRPEVIIPKKKILIFKYKKMKAEDKKNIIEYYDNEIYSINMRKSDNLTEEDLLNIKKSLSFAQWMLAYKYDYCVRNFKL